MTATITQPSFQNDQKTLIDELLKSELFESLPIESIEEYLRSYENVFGIIALELLIEECLEKLKNREYKKLLELLSIFMNAKKESLAVEEKDLPPLNIEGSITPKTVGESLTIDELHEIARCIEVRLAELVFSNEINLDEAQSLIENFYDLSPAEICMYTDEILEMLIENVHELKANELVGLIYSFQSKPIKLENSKTQTTTTLLTPKTISLDQALSTEHEYTLGEHITHLKEIEKALQRLEDIGAITQDQAEQIFESLNRIPFASDEFKSKVLEVAIEVKYREVENDILPVLHQSVELTGRSNSAKHASSNIEKIVSSNAALNSTSNEIKITAIPDGLKVVIEKAGVVLYKDAEGKPAGHAHVKEDGSLEYHPPGHECGPLCAHDTPEPLTIQPIQLNS